MNRLLSNTLLSVSKRMAILLNIGLFLLLNLTIIPLVVKHNNVDGYQSYVNSSAWALLILQFVFSTLHTTFSIMVIFKEGESNGTDLILFSKPFKRYQIILSRFLSLFLTLIAFQFLSFFIVALSLLGDQGASSNDILMCSFSISFGGLVIQLIVASIILAISTFIGKIGTMTIGMIMSFLIPCLSAVLVPTTNGNSSFPGISQSSSVVVFDGNNDYFVDPDTLTLYGGNVLIDDNKDGTITSEEAWGTGGEFERQFVSYYGMTSYDIAKYFDVWYQWSGMFNIFRNINSTDLGRIERVDTKRVEIDNSKFNTIDIGLNGNIKEKYIIMVPLYDRTELLLPSNKINGLLENDSLVSITKSWGNNDELEWRISQIDDFINTELANEFSDDVDISRINSYILYTEIMENNHNISLPTSVGTKSVEGAPQLIKVSDDINPQLSSVQYTIIYKDEWMSFKWVITFWMIITTTLLLFTFIVYYRRDYK